MTAVRIAHVSDVHLTARPLGWRPRDLLSKRPAGWANVAVFGRGRRFRAAGAVAAAFAADVRARRPDAVAFSGDASLLGFEAEVAAAARALGVGDGDLPPAVAVPGNHDRYAGRDVPARTFERHFAPWQVGDRAGGADYPFARRVGGVWLIGLASATPNRLPWDASGAVGPDQLGRFGELCRRLGPGPRLVVTHYPLRTADGGLEPRWHRLRDHAAVLAAAAECRVAAWLHGHIHRPFVLPASAAVPFPLVCAGSGTQAGRWGYHEYVVGDRALGVVRRAYDPASGGFVDAGTTEVELGGL